MICRSPILIKVGRHSFFGKKLGNIKSYPQICK
jgi:hypothetical protein